MASPRLIMDDIHYLTDTIQNAQGKLYLYDIVVEQLVNKLNHPYPEAVEGARKFFGVTVQ